MISKIKHNFFIGCFFAILLYSLYGVIWDGKINLSGVIQNVKKPGLVWSDILSGKYQKDFEDYFNNNFYGRELLIKLRSQFLYSLFGITPNTNVMIGRDGYLYEYPYINTEFNIEDKLTSVDLKEVVDKIVLFDELLKKNGKKLYLFITPNKVFFTRNQVPWSYSLLRKSESNILLDDFTNLLKSNGINFINSREVINDKLEQYNFPVFYSTGIHWSRAWGTICVSELWNLINQTNDNKYSSISLNFEKKDEIEWPDADLYQTLNLFTKPRDNYYQGSISILEKKNKPNVFARGGSFLGQSWSELVRSGVFNKDIHFENHYFFTNGYTSQTVLPSYDQEYGKDKLIKEYFYNSEIVVIEINEVQIPSPSFGFIDFVLNNQKQFFEQDKYYRFQDAQIKDQIWDDGWVGPSAYVEIDSKDSGTMILELWDPNWELHKEGKVSLYNNDEKLVEFEIQESNSITFNAPANSKLKLVINSNFSKLASETDLREISFVLTKLESI